VQGLVLDHHVDSMHEIAFPDEDLGHPWVATMWAGMRARELRRQSDTLEYLARMCERFGLIGPESVALGLEPALENRLPPLMGAPVAELDPPEQPSGPAQPEIPPADAPERRQPPLGPLGPGGSGGAPANPLLRPAPSPTIPAPAPAPRAPTGRAGRGPGS
jgi:hypothetical protein